MSDNLRRYDAIKKALVQLYPQAPTGHLLQSLNVLAMFINGIVASKSTHSRAVAQKTPTAAKVTSREKQLTRWYENEHVTYQLYMLPCPQGVSKACWPVWPTAPWPLPSMAVKLAATVWR